MNICPESEGEGVGEWALSLVCMNAVDFTRVHTTGWIEIDGTKYEIDNYGPVSIHYGKKLVDSYIYCATLFNPANLDSPEILAVSFTGDVIRKDGILGLIGKLIEEKALTYAYGRNGISEKMSSIEKYTAKVKIPVGYRDYISISKVKTFTTEFLGVKTKTGSAKAKLYLHKKVEPEVINLGQLILDYRADYYIDTLT